ncbi:MAG: ribosome maturation factor RimM [Bacillota bacterium]|nr:ribosome maturation factor RimM [Bacillota bacterium]
MNDFLQVGKIVNTHGVKGELKVIPLTDDPTRFDDLEDVFVGTDTSMNIVNIESVKYFKNTVIIKFKEVLDMNDALKLKDQYIYIDRKNAVKLPKDTYFICDLIGLEVFEDGNRIGEIKDIIQTGSNDVYIVKDEENKEILIPALKTVVKAVSIENKRMEVSLPEGLLD